MTPSSMPPDLRRLLDEAQGELIRTIDALLAAERERDELRAAVRLWKREHEAKNYDAAGMHKARVALLALLPPEEEK